MAVIARGAALVGFTLAGAPHFARTLPLAAERPSVGASTPDAADDVSTYRAAAHTLAIAGHVRLPYSSIENLDTWDGLTSADAEPAAPGNVRAIYGNASYCGGSCGEGGSCVTVVTVSIVG